MTDADITRVADYAAWTRRPTQPATTTVDTAALRAAA